jgi:hypothetical protein
MEHKLTPYSREDEQKYVSVRQSGTLGISKEAIKSFLPDVEQVELFYDTDAEVMGIAPAEDDSDDERTYKLHLSEGTGTINAGTFLRRMGIDTDQTERYGAEMQEVETTEGLRKMVIAKLSGTPWSVYNATDDESDQETDSKKDDSTLSRTVVSDSNSFISIRQSDDIGISKQIIDDHLEDAEYVRIGYNRDANELFISEVDDPENTEGAKVYKLTKNGGSGSIAALGFLNEHDLKHEETTHYAVTIEEIHNRWGATTNIVAQLSVPVSKRDQQSGDTLNDGSTAAAQ